MVGGKLYASAVKSLWSGKCTVWARVRDEADEQTGRALAREVCICRDEPCRISFTAVKPTQTENSAAAVTQSITLYIDRAVDIPEGSKITVTQNGITGDYEKSGRAGVYSTHREIPLELFKGWA